MFSLIVVNSRLREDPSPLLSVDRDGEERSRSSFGPSLGAGSGTERKQRVSLGES